MYVWVGGWVGGWVGEGVGVGVFERESLCVCVHIMLHTYIYACMNACTCCGFVYVCEFVCECVYI
jgi:hypothetical protein